MPIQHCCDISTKIIRLTSIEDSDIKTHAYLTLEILYASRRFTNMQDHIESVLRQLLDNQEVLSQMRGLVQEDEARIISYLQATTQVMLNLATSDINANDVLKYVSACFSVYCEYLVNTSRRIKNATFQALRMIIQQCLNKSQFEFT